MAYKVVRAADVALDLELIFDFHAATDELLGKAPEPAVSLAERSLERIEDALEDLGRIPHQGTLKPHLGDGVRSVTKGLATFHFRTDDKRETVHVLAVLFGSQDHQFRTILRLLSQSAAVEAKRRART